MFEIRNNLEFLRKKKVRLTKKIIRNVAMYNIMELLLIFRNSELMNKEIGMWITDDLKAYMNVGKEHYCISPIHDKNFLLDFHTHPGEFSYPSVEDRFLTIGKQSRISMIIGEGFTEKNNDFHIFVYSINKKHPMYDELYNLSQIFIWDFLNTQDMKKVREIIESQTDLFKVEINIFLDAEKVEKIVNELVNYEVTYRTENMFNKFKRVHPTKEEKKEFFNQLMENHKSGELTVDDSSWEKFICAKETKNMEFT